MAETKHISIAWRELGNNWPTTVWKCDEKWCETETFQLSICEVNFKELQKSCSDSLACLIHSAQQKRQFINFLIMLNAESVDAAHLNTARARITNASPLQTRVTGQSRSNNAFVSSSPWYCTDTRYGGDFMLSNISKRWAGQNTTNIPLHIKYFSFSLALALAALGLNRLHHSHQIGDSLSVSLSFGLS